VSSYLTVEEFKLRTTMHPSKVAAIDSQQPGFVAMQIAITSSWIEARLAKRYKVPFSAPYPEQVKTWTTAIVTLNLWERHGYDPTDPGMATMIANSDAAATEVREAADGQLALFDLTNESGEASLVSKGTPRAYSEASPYVGTDVRRNAGRREDLNRRGT
jgi:hypothetical protein